LQGLRRAKVTQGSLTENQAGQIQSATIQSNRFKRSPSIAKPGGPTKKGRFWVLAVLENTKNAYDAPKCTIRG